MGDNSQKLLFLKRKPERSKREAVDVTIIALINLFKGTLIRFVNRKRSDEIKSNRSKMNQVNLETFNIPAHNKIYLNDNLSPYFKSIAYKCRSLKRRDLIIQSKIDKGLEN